MDNSITTQISRVIFLGFIVLSYQTDYLEWNMNNNIR